MNKTKIDEYLNAMSLNCVIQKALTFHLRLVRDMQITENRLKIYNNHNIEFLDGRFKS